MKSVALATFAVIATWNMADAKGVRQVFNAPYPYDYSREKKPGYVKDYCEDAVGNHLYCTGGAQARAYVSKYQPK